MIAMKPRHWIIVVCIVAGVIVTLVVLRFWLRFSAQIAAQKRVYAASERIGASKPNDLTEQEWESLWKPTFIAIVNVCPAADRDMLNAFREHLDELATSPASGEKLLEIWKDLETVEASGANRDSDYVARYGAVFRETLAEVQRSVRERSGKRGEERPIPK